MPAVRALLTRVAKLEQAKAPALSPFEAAYGSLDAFVAMAQAQIDAGELDPRDGPPILAAIRRWHTDEVWGLWQ
jgi:hypothetical protein